MSSDKTTVNWLTDKPEYAGLYFAAVKYGPTMGVFEFIEWDGQEWVLENKADIIAYIGLLQVKDLLNVDWPDFDPKSKYTKNPDAVNENWEEHKS